MSISSLSSLATTAFDTAKSTLKAMADAATAPPTDAAAAKTGANAATAKTGADAATTEKSTAADLGLMTLDTLDTVDVKTAWTAAETPKTTGEEKPARPRSRLGNSLDSYA
jgi:3-phosphoglycerate kinase